MSITSPQQASGARGFQGLNDALDLFLEAAGAGIRLARLRHRGCRRLRGLLRNPLQCPRVHSSRRFGQ